MLSLYDLRTNHMVLPYVDGSPEFSWRIASERQNLMQAAYEIKVFIGNEPIWSSGKTDSCEQSFVPYGGELRSCASYRWELTVWDNYGNSATSDSYFETAFLSINEWKGCWAQSTLPRNEAPLFTYGVENPALRFSKKFDLPSSAVSARLYATCYGVYRPYLNGVRIGKGEFAPEFTPYDKILNYQAYDVTDLVSSGENRLEMLVGDGWYFCPQTAVVTDNRVEKPTVLFQLEVTFADGKRQTVCSDESVTVSSSNIVFSDLFQGEKVDKTLPEGEQYPIKSVDIGFEHLRLQPMPQVKEVERFAAKSVYVSPKGETIVDFGQNIAGRVKVRISEPKGAVVNLEHTEVVDAKGNYFATMMARQCDTYVTDGLPCEFEPIFTFHGFRYVRVTGMSEPKKEDFTAILLSTEKENVGDFECNDERFNRLYKNIRYSQKNNMLSVPTDCPTREKAAWCGDVLVYAKAGLLNEGMTPFLLSWLDGVVADQQEDGVIPLVSPYSMLYDGVSRKTFNDFALEKQTGMLDSMIPSECENLPSKPMGIAGWSDAIVWVPYYMYEVSGNIEILRRYYRPIKRWCDYVLRTAESVRGSELPKEVDKYLWNSGFHFGEWLIPGRSTTGFSDCATSGMYVAPYFGYKSVFLASKIAKLLGEKQDAEFYAVKADKIKQAIRQGLFETDALPELQGAYVLAFAFDLVPDEFYEEYKQRLVALVENNATLCTGFLATPFLLDVLEKLGRSDLAQKILWQNKSPSWLYEVEKGATTIWENWCAMDENGNPQQTSFDHYAFGVVDEWICRRVCGIDSEGAGFRRIIIAPHPMGFERLKRSFICEAGKIAVEIDGNLLKVTIPPNTTATVIWKDKTSEVGSGTYVFGDSNV